MHPGGTFIYESVRLGPTPTYTTHFTFSRSMNTGPLAFASTWMMDATAASGCAKINYSRPKW